MTVAETRLEFARFVLAGGVAALVNFCSRIVYDAWTSYSVAIVLAYVTGMVTAFVLNRKFVFPKTGNSAVRSAIIFAVINLFAVLQTWAVSIALSRYALPYLGVRRFVPELAHAVGVVVPVVTSYIGHRRWTFR